MNKLSRLLNVINKTKQVAKESIPLVVKIPIDKIPLSERDNLRCLTNRLSVLIEGIVFSDEISLNELAQNNYEFLDTLRTILFRLSNILNKNRISYLQAKIDNLIVELNSPPFLQHRKRTPTDDTEPKIVRFIYLNIHFA